MKNFILLLILSISTLNAFSCDLPHIKRQPNDIYACKGRKVVLQSLFTDTTDLDIRWERSDDNGATWTTITAGVGCSFFDTQTILVDSITNNNLTWLFRCVGTNPCGTTTSKEVKLINANHINLSMLPSGPEIDLSPGDTLWIEAKGATYYNWKDFDPSIMTDDQGGRIGFFPSQSGTYTLKGTFLKCLNYAPVADTSNSGYLCDWVRDDTSAVCNNAIYTDTCRLCNPCIYGDFPDGGGTETASIPFTICVGRKNPIFNSLAPICVGDPAPSLPGTSTNGVSGMWSPPFVSNTASGSYNFTPAVGSCASPTSLFAIVVPGIIPTFNPVSNYCPGATIPALPTVSNEGITGVWFPSIDNQNTTTYTFMPNPGQCAETTTLTITILPNTIQPQFGLLSIICKGDVVQTLSTTSFNGITGMWTPPVIDNINDGTYIFTPNPGQCALPLSHSVDVQESTYVFPTDSVPYCRGTAFTIIDVVGPGTWTWSPATVDFYNSGSYTITGMAGYCPVSFVVDIKIIPPTATHFTAYPDYCRGATIPDLPTTSLEGIDGTWSSPSVDNQATATYTFTPNSGECATTATMTIVVNDQVASQFSPFPDLCSGSTVTPLPTTSNNGVNGTWSPTQFNTAALGTQTAVFTPDNTACALSATASITILPSVKPSFPVFLSYCKNESIPTLPTTSNEGIVGHWNPSTINNQTTTTYTFTANNATCTDTVIRTVVITNNVIPQFNALADICLKSTVPSLPTTSTNGISGHWNPTQFDSNTAGTQTATFTANPGTCAEKAQLTLNVIDVTEGAEILTNGPLTFCQGDSVVLTINSTNNIIWYPSQSTGSSITAHTTGYYWAKIENGICSSFTDSVHVLTVAPATINVTSNSPLCVGDALLILSSESTGNYSWTGPNGFTASTPVIQIPTTTASNKGTYILTFSNGACITKKEVEIVVNNLPTVTLSAFPDLCINYDAIQLTQGNPTGGEYSSSSATLLNNQQFDPKTNGVGTFPITYTFNDGLCSNSATGSILVGGCAGLNELDQTFAIYPNPSNGLISIEGNTYIEEILVTDQLGKILLKHEGIGNTAHSLDLSSLANGTYFLDILSSGKRIQEKITLIR